MSRSGPSLGTETRNRREELGFPRPGRVDCGSGGKGAILNDNRHDARPQPRRPKWTEALTAFTHPHHGKAIWQLVNTVVPYIGLWALMIWTVQSGQSYWLTLGLSVLTAAFLVRIFIFFHDCVHGCFFRSRRANRWLGHVTGLVTFTPFTNWGRSHIKHHATSSDLDRRGLGDMWLMTTEEYLSASRWERLAYRLYRHPLVMFGLGPVITFLVVQRLPDATGGVKGRRNVWVTNVALVAMVVLGGLLLGFREYAIIQLPVILIAGVFGIWLFYVQHDFEGVYWARHEERDPMRAALEGASFYRLPAVLQWFAGNIGYHHVHHLKPNIPNYNLVRAHRSIPELQAVPPQTLWKSLRFPWLKLWDEQAGKHVGFRAARKSRA